MPILCRLVRATATKIPPPHPSRACLVDCAEGHACPAGADTAWRRCVRHGTVEMAFEGAAVLLPPSCRATPLLRSPLPLVPVADFFYIKIRSLLAACCRSASSCFLEPLTRGQPYFKINARSTMLYVSGAVAYDGKSTPSLLTSMPRKSVDEDVTGGGLFFVYVPHRRGH